MSEHCPRPRLPEWIRMRPGVGTAREEVTALMQSLSLHTVCQSARCPNLAECWHKRTATFMILGNTCTRNCKFCSVTHGSPEPIDLLEDEHIAEAAEKMNLRYAVLTSVTRDDLPDGGSAHFARVIKALKAKIENICVEVLTPDFNQDAAAIKCVLDAAPTVFSHNVETVERMTPLVRYRATYYGSLKTLRIAHELSPYTPIKSGLMLGLGETDEEIIQTLKDLREAGVTMLTLGQYLPPTAQSYPLARYVTPEAFDTFKTQAVDMGFTAVASGPMVRSSYHAEELTQTL